MKTYVAPCLALMLALCGTTSGQQATAPTVVQVEGLEKLVTLLQRIDRGIAHLAYSRWEYKIVQRNRFNEDQERQIEALGRDGWELVNATVQEGFIFKRRVSQ